MGNHYPSSFRPSVSMAHSNYIHNFFLFLILAFYGCDTNVPQERQMVVEGWIEEGKEPVVMLHYAYAWDDSDVSDTATLADIAGNLLERYARVSISDGENETVLTGQLNSKYFPPYIYTSTHIVGEAGRTYTVKATRNNISATATTSIPTITPIIDSISVRNIHDTTQAVVAYIKVPTTSETIYYNAFLRRKGEFQLRSFLMSHVQSSQAKNGQIELPVYSNKNDANMLAVRHFFQTDTTQYYLHLSIVDEMSYLIWEGISAQSINQGMYFMGIYKNMPSNVSSGLGYWCGYNSSEYAFKVNHDTTFVYGL